MICGKMLRILHYALGYPPARTGGQVLYVLDLIRQQIAAGHELAYLYPGRLNPLVRCSYVKSLGRTAPSDPQRFELVNSLPLPLFGGIRQPKDFCKSSDTGIFLRLFESWQPDVIHVHTLMGLYREFMVAAKQYGIPVVFTSHDYFGLSPVPDFYFGGKSWHNDNSIEFWCGVGMHRAMRTRTLRVFQLGIYPRLRDFLKRLRGAQHATPDLPQLNDFGWSTEYANDMDALRVYYREIFSMVKRFHFNSTIARDVFHANLGFSPRPFDMVPVTNTSVTRFIHNERLPNTPKRVAYIGPYLEYKGFFDFLDLVNMNTNPNLEFHLWGDDRQVVSMNVINHGRFQRTDVDQVFSGIDVLVFPTKWQETFGLVAIEALDHGVPVLASWNAGVKDILPSGWVFNSKEKLFELVNTVPSSVPTSVRDKLRTMAEHTMEISEIYYKSL
jgi:glycosyltransferase involved in cell wall biosynthesis